MKAFLFLAVLIPFCAQANVIELTGTFVAPARTASATKDPMECREQGGMWENESCVYLTEHHAHVTRRNDAYFFNVLTWGPDGDACDFTAQAELVNNTLVGEAQDEGHSCRLVVTYLDEHHVSVAEAPGSSGCRHWCEDGAPGFRLDKAARARRL